MADIFLSYAREDAEVAETLAEALRHRDFDVFSDRTVPPGKTWRSFIGAALDAARCVVVGWSAASLASKWVIEEAEEGDRRDVLVPVLFESVTPPMGFRSIQAADLSGWNGDPDDRHFGLLEAAVRQLLEGEPVGESLSGIPDGSAPAPPGTDEEYRLDGVWEGEMYQSAEDRALSHEPFDVRLVLTRYAEGGRAGTIEHRRLGCRGSLTWVGREEGAFIVEQRIDHGRQRCLDGLNRLVFLDPNTLERTWTTPDFPGEVATGTLRRVSRS